MHSLERLDVYRLSRELAVRIYRFTKTPPLAREFGLADQIRCAAVSVPSNIAEGVALGTRRQLVRGLRIAFGSVQELRTQLWIADRAGVLPAGDESTTVSVDLGRVASMLVGLLKRYGAKPNS